MKTARNDNGALKINIRAISGLGKAMTKRITKLALLAFLAGGLLGGPAVVPLTGSGVAHAQQMPELPDGMTMHDIRNPEPRRGFKDPYNAIESDKLRISIDGTSNGFVEGRVCDHCEDIKVTITPDTKAYANGKEVSLSAAANRIGRFATVIYERESMRVTEIRW